MERKLHVAVLVSSQHHLIISIEFYTEFCTNPSRRRIASVITTS